MLQVVHPQNRTQTNELYLWFSTEPVITLERTLFHTEFLSEPVIAVRGKSTGAFPTASTFQWYLGPQALMIFFLRSISHQTRYLPVLEGGAGSLAACLDMIVEKSSSWLFDLFGCRADGSPLIRKILRRSNAGRRRGGIVSFSLNDKFLSPENVHVIVDGEKVTGALELTALADAIEFQWMSKKASLREVQLPSRPDKPSYRESEKGRRISRVGR